MAQTEQAVGSTRERLVDAAKCLFTERGFAATSTRAIAGRAGCNLALINHYFGSKQGLLRAILAQGAATVGDELRAIATSEAPAAKRIERFVDFMIDHFAQNCDGMQILHRELLQNKAAVLEEMRPRVAENTEAFVRILQAADAEGRLGDVDPKIAGVLLVGMLQFYFTAYPLTSGLIGPRSPELVASLKRHIKQIFLHGVLREPVS